MPVLNSFTPRRQGKFFDKLGDLFSKSNNKLTKILSSLLNKLTNFFSSLFFISKVLEGV